MGSRPFFLMVIFVVFVGSIQAQVQSIFDDVLFDSSMFNLEGAIKDASRRHAIYSYNLANATTPGFKPILLDDDQRELFSMVPPGSEYFTNVVVEHMTSKMALNRSRQSGFYALYKKKLDNYKQIVTLGKK